MSNLTQRILTAVVLAVAFVLTLWVDSPWPFWLLTLLLIAAAAWEWSRLGGWTGWDAWASGALCAVCAVGLMKWLPVVLGVVCLLWIVGSPWLLRRGVARWSALPQWLRWSLGMAMLAVAWGALATAHAWGVNFLLSALALVWAADIGGYVFGRALGGKLTGGRKLAPAISPGKTWEGALGGFVGVLLVGAVWIWVDSAWPDSPSLYAILWSHGPLWFLAGLAFLTAMSVVGDLLESLVKRAAGAKDSSQLLPGHGGVLDRIDALLPTLPLTVTMVLYLPSLMKLLSGSLP